METHVNEKLLDEKLAELEKARAWTPRAVSKLESLIRGVEDFALFRINPIQFATEKAVPEQEAIDMFLHGTKLGVFQMEWNLVCPSCGDFVESFKSLNKVNSHFYCTVCNLNSSATLDDLIQVSFTISPQVRDIVFHHPDALSVEDFHFRYHFNQTARIPDGPRFIDVVPALVKTLAFLPPGEKKRSEIEAAGGTLTFNDLMHHESVALPVTGTPVEGTQTVTLRLEGGKLVLDRAEVFPGRITFSFENKTAGKASMMVLNFPPGKANDSLVFAPSLSGKRLLTTQTFRDLFSSEVIHGTEGIGVRDITILFTDLKGSTALYDRIGDLKAFSLVHQHFDRLGKVITENSGAFVKTIGDAVMASFLNPSDALKAGLGMLREISRFNQSFTNKDVILKIGIHKGACIAVTLNDRLDYFGQTVNIASRVQGLAGAEEVYVTESVFSHPGVKKQLAGFKVFAGKVRLKGIKDEMQVYKITAATSGGAKTAPLQTANSRDASLAQTVAAS